MRRAVASYEPPPTDISDEELIRRYSWLVTRVARRIAVRTGIPNLADDLWSAGALGLLEAAHRFEVGRAARFESFAEHRIRGAMLDELRRLDHLPRRLRDRTDDIARVRQRLHHELKREPEPSEIAIAAEVTVEELGELDGLVAQPLDALELPLPHQGPDPEQSAGHARTSARLATAIAALPERLQMLLSLHYEEGLTYREIAKLLGVSEPRVCQLHGDAVAKLKASMTAADGGFPTGAEAP